MVIPSAAILTVPLTVAVHALKKPCIYAGFNNLNTDGHGWTRMKKNSDANFTNYRELNSRKFAKFASAQSVFICVHLCSSC